jgi:anti-sigma-K factor RskA
MSLNHLDAETLSAYALDALDAPDRQSAREHLAGCDECRRELATFDRVTTGLLLAVPPEAPPASLRARTIARAMASTPAAVQPGPAPSVQFPTAARQPRIAWQGLAAAAALVLAAGFGVYVLALRSEVRTLQQTVTTLSERADNLRDQLRDARQNNVNLLNTMQVLRAPDTVRVDMRGTAPGSSLSGRAFVSGARGLVVDVQNMPALPPGRVFQLWLIPPGAAPISAGVFTVDAAGTASFVRPMPAGAALPQVVAVTMEDGPDGSVRGPTSDPLLAGSAGR